MRILIVSPNFSPEKVGVGKYTGEMAEWLAERGHEVRCVTTHAHYPEWRLHEPGNGRGWSVGQVGSIKVYRCPVLLPKNQSGPARLLFAASFALSSVASIIANLRWRPDVVWTVEPTLAAVPSVLGFAWITRARSWLHIQDYEIDAAFQLGIMRNGILKRLCLAAEKWLLRRFWRVSTISTAMMSLARSKGVDEERLFYFPNWAEVDDVHVCEIEYRESLGIQKDVLVALYSGSMGAKQGLETLIECARKLQNEPGILFVLCGSGPAKQKLVEACAGLGNVKFMDFRPPDQLSAFLRMADIHLLPQRADAADLVLPSKLTGMLASGRATLVCADPRTSLGRLVEHEARCGLLVPPEDALSLSAAVLKLAGDGVARREYGENGKRYALAELRREAVLGRFESALLH